MLAWWEHPHSRKGTMLVLCPTVSEHEGFYAPAPNIDLYRTIEYWRSGTLRILQGFQQRDCSDLTTVCQSDYQWTATALILD